MRFRALAMAAMGLAACDQVTIPVPEASWTGSMGRLVVDGGDPGNLEFVHLDGAGPEHGEMTLVSVEDGSVEQAPASKRWGNRFVSKVCRPASPRSPISKLRLPAG